LIEESTKKKHVVEYVVLGVLAIGASSATAA